MVLPQGKYQVVCADFPWDHYGSPDKMGAAGKEYDLMRDVEVMAFPMADLLEKPGVLFLWATCPRLDAAIDAIKSWGLHYRGLAFVWVKTTQAGVPIGAQGVRPSVVKPLTELCLVASNKKRGRPLPLGSESVTQTIFAPRGAHSEKPLAALEKIDVLYPNASKIELFCRGEARVGWNGWGDEFVESLDTPQLY